MADTKKRKRLAGPLKNWMFEPGADRVVGNIYNDERFANGERIRSSQIVCITVETHNSIYVLDPDESNGSGYSSHE